MSDTLLDFAIRKISFPSNSCQILGSFLLSFIDRLSIWKEMALLRLVFTSEGVGVVVGAAIRSVERYDLVKIKSTQSEAEPWFCLWLRRLWSSENCIVGVASRSGRINQWQCSILGLAIGWFFRFCFQLRQRSFYWIVSDGVINRIGGNGNVLILPTPIPLSLWLRLRLGFSVFTRS